MGDVFWHSAKAGTRHHVIINRLGAFWMFNFRKGSGTVNTLLNNVSILASAHLASTPYLSLGRSRRPLSQPLKQRLPKLKHSSELFMVLGARRTRDEADQMVRKLTIDGQGLYELPEST